MEKPDEFSCLNFWIFTIQPREHMQSKFIETFKLRHFHTRATMLLAISNDNRMSRLLHQNQPTKFCRSAIWVMHFRLLKRYSKLYSVLVPITINNDFTFEQNATTLKFRRFYQKDALRMKHLEIALQSMNVRTRQSLKSILCALCT